MYHLCKKYYKPITLQYFTADDVSWIFRVNFVGLTNKSDLQTHSQNGTHLYVGDLL